MISSSSSSSLYPALILYGSQTGNAEEIARSFHAAWWELLHQKQQQEKKKQEDMNGVSSSSSPLRVMSMADYCKEDDTLDKLPSFNTIIFVISTTGQGEKEKEKEKQTNNRKK